MFEAIVLDKKKTDLITKQLVIDSSKLKLFHQFSTFRNSIRRQVQLQLT